MIQEQPWYKRLGPGLITAAVVLGPGSIVSASTAGARSGYGLIWMLAVSAIVMATFTSMAARIGCALDKSFLSFLAERWGRPMAAITGISAFVVAAGFQFGNNIGVSVAMQGVFPSVYGWIWPIVFTALSILFMSIAKDVYHLLELVMRFLVAAMMIAFVGNLFFTGINPVELGKGLIPGSISSSEFIIATSLLGTTFSAVAAFYQAYLVQAKGWQRSNVRFAIQDAWIGIAILGGISMVIMIGAAQSLHGKGGEFKNIGELAAQLQGVLGNKAILVFSFGLGAAAFSSFITNALIGGALLTDGFGLDTHMESRPTRIAACAGLLIGCIVAVITMTTQVGGPQSVLIAQTSTIIASPLCALLMFYFANNKALMGDLRNGIASNVIGGAGILILLYLASQTFLKVTAAVFGG
ncbi:MAG: divalent metal cation transporter [Candidatus Hydrogenedentes bacterium]|nr:divalent metal cation transporter [Candidatus Hydrogenedentota bacterium]